MYGPRNAKYNPETTTEGYQNIFLRSNTYYALLGKLTKK